MSYAERRAHVEVLAKKHIDACKKVERAHEELRAIYAELRTAFLALDEPENIAQPWRQQV